MSLTKTPQSKLTSANSKTKRPRAASGHRPASAATASAATGPAATAPAATPVPSGRSPRPTAVTSASTTATTTTPADAASTAAPVAVGVDVSKAYLDVDAPGRRWRVPNTPAGAQELLA